MYKHISSQKVELNTDQNKDQHQATEHVCCRICLDESTKENPLIEPCLCSGSLQYVHQGCLMEWIKARSFNCKLVSNQLYCDLCQYPFVVNYDVSMIKNIKWKVATNIVEQVGSFIVIFLCVCFFWSCAAYSINNNQGNIVRWNGLVQLQQWLQIKSNIVFFAYVGYFVTMVGLGVYETYHYMLQWYKSVHTSSLVDICINVFVTLSSLIFSFIWGHVLFYRLLVVIYENAKDECMVFDLDAARICNISSSIRVVSTNSRTKIL